jgi:SSS family solute:Na+ symporter
MMAFGALNCLILAVYLLGMILIGLFFSKKQHKAEDYFLAGRNMPWLPVAMSMFASLTSAITFMGLPARAYEENMALLVVCFISPLLVPILVFVLYPAYRKHGVTTSYEFIGIRYGRAGRTAVSALFILARLGWMATVVFAPALALSIATGMPLALTILLMGGMATLYTALGGLAAVLWTDVVQFMILITGAFWVAIDVILKTSGGIPKILDVANSAGHLHVVGWDISLFEMSGLVVAVSFFLQMLQDYGTDQVTVQRMLAVKTQRGVTKAAIFNACTDVVMVALLLFIGLGLFAYYQLNPQVTAPPSADAALPHYIMQALPPGVSGLLISAIFAAAMSSMDSGINSLATVIEHDFIKQFWSKAPTGKPEIARARLLTLMFGILATGLAFGVSHMENIIDSFATFMGLFSAPVLALFLLGLISKHARFWAWAISVPLAIGGTLILKLVIGAHWVYFVPFAFSISYAVTWLLSAIATLIRACPKHVHP